MTDNTSRSRSRGRELFSTGRGGAGNIHGSPSRGADGSQTRGGYNYEASPAPRGREPAPGVEHITHVGRGGAGNIREASRPRESEYNFRSLIFELDGGVYAGAVFELSLLARTKRPIRLSYFASLLFIIIF